MTRDEILQAAREALAGLAPARAAALSPLLELPPTGTFSPDHATIAEVTLVRSIETILRAHLADEATPVIDQFALKRRESRAYSTFLPRSGESFGRTEGIGSSRLPLSQPCPACQQAGGIHYVGSDVVDGSLENYHLMHTEVADWFECSRCQYAWSEDRYL